MNTAAIKFDAFENLKNQDCQQRILKARKVLGDEIVILRITISSPSIFLALRILC